MLVAFHVVPVELVLASSHAAGPGRAKHLVVVLLSCWTLSGEGVVVVVVEMF